VVLAAAGGCSLRDPVMACAESDGAPHVIRSQSSCLPGENASCCSNTREEEIMGVSRGDETRPSNP
jgi:hypothetical protein